MTRRGTFNVLMAIGIFLSVLTLYLIEANSEANAASRTVNIGCGQDVDNIINGDPALTSTQFVLAPDCTFTASSTVVPKHEDEIVCQIFPTFIQRGSVRDPEPRCTIAGSSSLTQVMKPQGTFFARGLTIVGGNYTGAAGTGVGLAEGAMNSNSWQWAIAVRDNEGAGISNAHGVHSEIELTNNTTNSSALGHIGAGIKGVDEFSIQHSYIHDTQGNGVWCDVYCNDVNSYFNVFHVHDNLIANNGRAGVRFEETADFGQDSQPNAGEALIENNEVHGNGTNSVRGGISVHDAQHALIRNNRFGAVTLPGFFYPSNVTSIAVRVTDSGRSDRPDTADVNVVNNTLNGETIKTCGGVVICQGNL
jgi:hypothetical protein